MAELFCCRGSLQRGTANNFRISLAIGFQMPGPSLRLHSVGKGAMRSRDIILATRMGHT